MYPRPIPEDAKIQRALYVGGVTLVVALWLLPGAVLSLPRTSVYCANSAKVRRVHGATG